MCLFYRKNEHFATARFRNWRFNFTVMNNKKKHSDPQHCTMKFYLDNWLFVNSNYYVFPINIRPTYHQFKNECFILDARDSGFDISRAFNMNIQVAIE
jgi:hypothetical protein